MGREKKGTGGEARHPSPRTEYHTETTRAEQIENTSSTYSNTTDLPLSFSILLDRAGRHMCPPFALDQAAVGSCQLGAPARSARSAAALPILLPLRSPTHWSSLPWRALSVSSSSAAGASVQLLLLSGCELQLGDTRPPCTYPAAFNTPIQLPSVGAAPFSIELQHASVAGLQGGLHTLRRGAARVREFRGVEGWHGVPVEQLYDVAVECTGRESRWRRQLPPPLTPLQQLSLARAPREPASERPDSRGAHQRTGIRSPLIPVAGLGRQSLQ